MVLILLQLFTVSYFLHMSSRLPLLGSLRVDLLLGVGTLVCIFFQQGQDKLRFGEETTKRLKWFLLYIVLSLPFVTWPGSVINNNLADWIKVVFFFMLVVGGIRTEKQLRLLLTVFLACQLFRILEPLYLHISTGYWGDVAYSSVGGVMSGLDRLRGAPHDVVNPNQLAWVIVSTIPFLFYLLWQWNWWGKLLFAVLLIPSTKALLLTGSRSGLLSLGAVILGIILLSKNIKRNLMICLVVILPFAIFMVGQLGSDMQTRYLSLVDSDVAGADTAKGRGDALIRQLGFISNNPLFGNGLGTSSETNWNLGGRGSQVTHNLYIEILQETGIIGLSLFLLYVFSIVKSLRESRQILVEKGYGETDWLGRVISATLVWVVMDLFYSLSCFGLRSWEWYFFGGVTTVCHVLSLERENSHNAEPEYA